jgi:uncharacterized protein (TIGR02466 family)
MSVTWRFATPIYHRPLLAEVRGNNRFARDISETAADIEKLDHQGRAWSKVNYRHGYTSYSSWDNLHQRHSDFTDLQHHIDRHVRRFMTTLDWDLSGRRVVMTQCWLNAMGPGAAHPFHLHPLAVISGTYYAQVDSKSASLQFEDPRIGFKMASPPVRTRSKQSPYVQVVPKLGSLILFESWLKHSVPLHNAPHKRLSVSFNYGLF